MALLERPPVIGADAEALFKERGGDVGDGGWSAYA